MTKQQNVITCISRSLGRHIGTQGIRNQHLYEISFRQKPNEFKTLENFLTFLKIELRLCQSTDLFATHYPAKSKDKRFELTYIVLSIYYNVRICFRINISEFQTIPSITTKFKAANWLEREIYDLFGVVFTNHPDLRPILTDYGFVGNPLRKDFPVTGYTQVKYDFEMKEVTMEPLNLSQEFRNFDFISPWKATPLYVTEKNERPFKKVKKYENKISEEASRFISEFRASR